MSDIREFEITRIEDEDAMRRISFFVKAPSGFTVRSLRATSQTMLIGELKVGDLLPWFFSEKPSTWDRLPEPDYL